VDAQVVTGEWVFGEEQGVLAVFGEAESVAFGVEEGRKGFE
jgi:hypothetical protein